MAKFEEVSKEVEALFDNVLENTTIPNWVEFRVLCNNKQKEVCKLVKANELVQQLTEGLNFAVIVNEDIFNEIPADMQPIVFDEILAGVSVSDSDALSINKPDFSTYSGVLSKYGDSKIIGLHESIKSLYDVKRQKEEEAKAQTKGKRGRKSKQF